MHTSKVLRSWDFQYWRLEEDGPVRRISAPSGPTTMSWIASAWSPLRSKTVWLGAGYALLAWRRLSTTCSDPARTIFFTYAQHFRPHRRERRRRADPRRPDGAGGRDARRVLGRPRCLARIQLASGASNRRGDAEESFSTSRSAGCSGPRPFSRATTNRAFFSPGRALLKSRLKAVTYYNAAVPTSKSALPGRPRISFGRALRDCPPLMARQGARVRPVSTWSPPFPNAQRYRQVSVDAFLEELDAASSGLSRRRPASAAVQWRHDIAPPRSLGFTLPLRLKAWAQRLVPPLCRCDSVAVWDEHLRGSWYCNLRLRHLIPYSAIQRTACSFFEYAAPLFEKERHVVLPGSCRECPAPNRLPSASRRGQTHRRQ